MSRCLPMVLLASLVAAVPAHGQSADFRLQVVPEIVYKVDDPGGARTSSFVFNLAVLCETDCQLTPISARVELSTAGSIVERQDWTAAMLAQIKRVSYRIEPTTPLASPTRAFTLPEAFDLRFYPLSGQGHVWAGLDHEWRPRRLLERLRHRHTRIGFQLCGAAERCQRE